MKLLARLRHPRITTVMGAVIHGHQTMMVMEIMYYGSLQDFYLNEMIEFDGDTVLIILKDVAAGMDFLHIHKPPICHGDLKACNILIDDQLRAKVADFGMAGRKRGAGTPYWMAPELLAGGRSSLPADVYAFGITLVEVLKRQLPYDNPDPYEVLSRVVDPQHDLRPTIPEGCGQGLATLMKKCWARNPEERPMMKEVNSTVQALELSEFSQMWAGTPVAAYACAVRYAALTYGMLSESDILYNLFPKHVADAMLRGEKVPEDRRECSTVFFSDICGFTTLSSKLDSYQVSEMLERLFSRFDEAAVKHGVYKLETIGDCYIAVTNLVTDQAGSAIRLRANDEMLDTDEEDDHVARMAAFSLEIIEIARTTLIDPEDPSKGHVEMRAGFDSGPIVGNVVGSKNKKYTVFGNTVNTASRMESTGVPMRVQCTRRSAKLLVAQDCSVGLERREHVQVKGRGTMTTYFLSRSSECTPPEQPAGILDSPLATRPGYDESPLAVRPGHDTESTPATRPWNEATTPATRTPVLEFSADAAKSLAVCDCDSAESTNATCASPELVVQLGAGDDGVRVSPRVLGQPALQDDHVEVADLPGQLEIRVDPRLAAQVPVPSEPDSPLRQAGMERTRMC